MYKNRSLLALLICIVFLSSGCSSSQKPTRTYSYSRSVVSAQPLRLASFNIRIFSNNSRNDEELDYITDILKQYDIIAIQELRDEIVLKRAVEMLKSKGIEYDYEISTPVGKSVKERYAFLYRKDKVNEIIHGKLYREQNDEFIREPYYATFKSGKFDFTLITIHTLYGKSENLRRPEIEALKKVFTAVEAENPKEKDVILCGDFNFPPTDKGFNNLKSLPGMMFLIVPPEKTTITDTSLYDNFWFQKQNVPGYTGKSGVYRFDEVVFENDDDAAKTAVSDHRPIWAEFDISKDGD